MVSKTITYTDYNGLSRTEEFYFNLTNAEVLDMETSVDGGWLEMVKKFAATENVPEIMRVFKDLIYKSYGEKSADGRRFIKSKELTDAFVQTEAYSDLFVELVTNPEIFADFVNNMVTPLNENSNTKTKTEIAVVE